MCYNDPKPLKCDRISCLWRSSFNSASWVWATGLDYVYYDVWNANYFSKKILYQRAKAAVPDMASVLWLWANVCSLNTNCTFSDNRLMYNAETFSTAHDVQIISSTIVQKFCWLTDEVPLDPFSVGNLMSCSEDPTRFNILWLRRDKVKITFEFPAMAVCSFAAAVVERLHRQPDTTLSHQIITI